MKTRHVPAMVMLIAGLITIILDIIQSVPLTGILKDMVIALVCFFIIGSIAKVILDRAFNPKTEDETEETEDFDLEEESEEKKPEDNDEESE